jgi:GT2 family glycosyltransferase
MKSIFIQITSYHDQELSKTIIDAIKKSSGINTINFGVHSIFFEENTVEVPNLPNVKVFYSKAPDNLGMGKGRAIAHQFYSGEDYYLQVDSHSRFDRNWDSYLINLMDFYKSEGIEKPLITNYPKLYWYENGNEVVRQVEDVVTQFYWKDPERFKLFRTPMQGSYAPNEFLYTSISVSGGSIFVEGEFMKPNELIFADGEEIFMAARAFTMGYTLMVPTKQFMYHLYWEADKDNKRRQVCTDFPDLCASLNQVSTDEIKLVLTEALTGEYRLGTQRSLKDYGDYCGLDFVNGRILANGEEVLKQQQ